MRRSDFSSGIEPSSLPPQALPLPDQRRSLGVRMNAFSPPPPPLQPFLGWISGVTLTGTLAQSGLPYGGSLSFETAIRLGLPSHTPSRERVRLSFASRSLVQLPPASGYLQQVPRGTFTLSHSSMPNAPGPRAAKRPRLSRGASGTPGPVPFKPLSPQSPHETCKRDGSWGREAASAPPRCLRHPRTRPVQTALAPIAARKRPPGLTCNLTAPAAFNFCWGF